MPSWGLSKYIKTKLQTTCFYLTQSFFFKKDLKLVYCLIFGMVFEEKYFSYYILLTGQISLSECLYFVKYLCIVIVCWPGCDVIKFEINLSIQIKSGFFWHDLKAKAKIWISWEQKAFFIIFNGLALKQIKQNFLEGESAALSRPVVLFVNNDIKSSDLFLEYFPNLMNYSFQKLLLLFRLLQADMGVKHFYTRFAFILIVTPDKSVFWKFFGSLRDVITIIVCLYVFL